MLNIEICCAGNLSDFVFASINISDSSGFGKQIDRDTEVINEVWGNEAFCSSAVNESADFGMEGSGVEIDECMDGFLMRNEDGLRE